MVETPKPAFTNSRKDQTNFDKFLPIFEAMNNSLLNQTKILQETLGVLIENDAKQAARDKLIEFRNKVEEDNQRRNNPKPEPTPAQQPSDTSGPGFTLGTLGLFDFPSLMRMLNTRNLGKLGIAALIAPIISDIIGKTIENVLTDRGFSEGLSESLGDTFASTSLGFLVGRVFGKKMGFILGGAGFLASFSDELLAGMGLTEEDIKNSSIEALGMTFDLNDLTYGILGAIGLGLTSYLSNPAFLGSLKAGISKVPAVMASRNFLTAGAGIAIAGLYYAYGDEINGWLEKQGAPESIGNVADLAVTGGSLGVMFGPTGILAGAAVGFALGVGQIIFDWLSGVEKKAFENVKKDLDKLSTEELSKLYAEGGDAAVIKNALNPTDANIVSRGKLSDEIQKRLTTGEAAATMSQSITDTSKGGSELATVDSLDLIADTFYNDKMKDKKQLNETYTNLLALQEEMKQIILDSKNNPSDEYLRNQANNYEFAIEDVATLLADMKNKGAAIDYKFGEIIPMIPKRPELPQTYPTLGQLSSIPNETAFEPVFSKMMEMLNSVSENSISTSSPSVVVVAPSTNVVNNNIKGGSSTSSTNVFGNMGGSTMDPYGMPRTAN